jgi:hypothetical protein
LPAIGWIACACGFGTFARCGTVARTLVWVPVRTVGEMEPQPTNTRAEIAVAIRSLIA